jgi:hypothetical protein
MINIDNPSHIDTVEVIGSIPVAPILVLASNPIVLLRPSVP